MVSSSVLERLRSGVHFEGTSHYSDTCRETPCGGTGDDWMKTAYGHDLEKLRNGIAERGSPLPRALSRAFVFVSTWDPNSRYHPGPGDPKDTTRFLAAVDAIVNWADERCDVWQGL